MNESYRRAARVADFVGKIDRKAKRPKTDHRKPPPGVKLLPRADRIKLLLKRDGDRCQCGCMGVIGRAPVEIEHKIRLEMVRQLPDEQRAWYFSLANERLFIAGHQVAKSAQEAAERAHFNRLAATPRPTLGIMSNAKADRLRAKAEASERRLAAKSGRA